MKRYAKIGLSACFYAVCALGGAIGRVFGMKRRPYMTILFYHAVPLAHKPSFARQMQQLARWARVVPADWEGDGAGEPKPDRRNVVAITFDDAFDSALDNAVPLLSKHGFVSTIFVPSGCLGAAPSWVMESDIDRAERVANAERLARLPADLVTIGSHTVTHPRLTSLSGDAVLDELARSMRDLTVLVGQKVGLLAFPYGVYNDAVVEMCRGSGYKNVFTIEPTLVSPSSGAFARGRVAVDATDGPIEFFLKAAGAYRWMPLASAIKRMFLLRA